MVLARKFQDHQRPLRVPTVPLTFETTTSCARVFRFYKKEGVNFTGDAFTDYTILVNCIYDDLSGEVIY